ncbi:MAG TPA: hypothetical protein VES73_08060 [Lamprocystis sp. (in: g-proteobacteria)]|nr:hypothetical protein [Lamprocystis sp. (in: g-proteobacteria)]
MKIKTLRDVDAAESACRRSLDLRALSDALGRSGCIQQIGSVHHERFNAARRKGEPQAVLLRHAQAAEAHYRQALDLCPASAIANLGLPHLQLGILYKNVGQTEPARQQYEQAAHLFEQTGNRYGAGQTRFNMALMYLDTAEREAAPPHRRDLLHRAQAYAQAALRDYRHYQGRAAADEAQAQQLIDAIGQAPAAAG